ncbi:ferrochelatase [Marinomonas epiphytica]
MSKQKIGVLLVNLGTPDEPKRSNVRKFLNEFLSDTRVVDLSPWLWKPILNGVILNFRPSKVAKVYEQVWMEVGSPLLVYSKRLQDKLSAHLEEQNLQIELAMTYGNPSVESAFKRFQAAGVDRVCILPMYPQYSSTTTAAVYDKVSRVLAKQVNIPGIVFIKSYADHPLYIQALAQSIQSQWAKQGEKRHVVFSYHGIPKRYVTKGDPYAQQCEQTSQLVAQHLELTDDEWTHVYQSRFGREEWLQPYADATLKALPGMGVKKINVISPAFSADCIETLEEIAIELAEEFKGAGGLAFDYVEALNDQTNHVNLYLSLIEQHTLHWK